MDGRISEHEEAPYDGRVGATRTEVVHLPEPSGGGLRSVTVHRGVNVATDPSLRARALSGTLHRVELGTSSVELALSYVFHDPAARKLALVIPEPLRHEALRERARFLAKLADDAADAVPSYVLEAPVVIGGAELEAFLARPSARDARAAEEAALVERRKEIGAAQQDLLTRDEALTQREAELAELEEALAAREERIRERAEDLLRREDELVSREHEHAAAALLLASREQDLAARQLETERAAELLAAASAERRLPRGASGGGLALEVVAMDDGELPSDDDAPIADDEDVEELEDLEPMRADSGLDPAIEPAAAAAEPERISITDDGVEELVDDEDIEEDVEDDDVDSGELHTGADANEPAAEDEPADPAPPDAEMVARFEDGVALDVALGDSADAFVADAELLVQLVVISGCPVVVLALVDPGDGTVRRAALDPRAPEGRRILESLRRRFEARTAFFDAQGALVRTGRVAGPRELNTARAVDRVARLAAPQEIEPDEAIAQVLADPPPISGASPFAAEEDHARFETAALTARALAELAEWSAPDKMDHALLVLSVPRDTIDATFARVLERAVEHGLALPAALIDRALGAGLADDVAAVVARQLAAFRATVLRPDRGGLDDETIAGNWERLLALSADAEVAIDAETHELAWRAIRAVRGEQTGSMPGGALDPARIAQMGNPELVMLLEHPRHRRAAAIALAERGDPRLAEMLCKAVRKMSRADIVRVVPRIAKLGDEAGDALIDGLSARKSVARQAFALALGHLRLRRAVVPLLHLLLSEPSDVWREVARVYGSFGQAGFRTLAQKLQDPKAPDERLVLALAHLGNNGSAKQVESLQRDGDPRVASLAGRALAARDEARRHQECVTGQRPLDGDAGALRFSRRFAEELEGAAPDDDLATLPDEEA